MRRALLVLIVAAVGLASPAAAELDPTFGTGEGETLSVHLEIDLYDSADHFTFRIRNNSTSASVTKAVITGPDSRTFDAFLPGATYIVSPSQASSNNDIRVQTVTLTFSGTGLAAGAGDQNGTGSDLDWAARANFDVSVTFSGGQTLSGAMTNVGDSDDGNIRLYAADLVLTPPADTTDPSVPAGLVATPVSASQIDLSWSASTDNVGVAGYRIFRGGVAIATTTQTSYSNTALSPSTTYTYTVSAYDAAGNESAQSASASATTQAQPVSCLMQAGPTITLSGIKTVNGEDDTTYFWDLADNTKIDASTAQYLGASSDQVFSLNNRTGGDHLCFHGGQIAGPWAPDTSWDFMHDAYAVVARVPNFTFENFQMFDYGDMISFDAQHAINWTIRGVHFKYSRDDCVENDDLNSGLIDDSFFDGCWSGVSSLDWNGSALDGSNNVVVIQNSLLRTNEADVAYSDDPVRDPRRGNGGFFKWGPTSPQVKLYNNVFRTDAPDLYNVQHTLIPPATKLADCSGNVMIWLGEGPFPEPLPSCFTLMTGEAGLNYWNNAVAQWKANHPSQLPDVVRPIVSMFSPGIVGSTTLTGTVTLTATAVDDQDIESVQFQLNGQNIGPVVTTESPITKFSLSWDSRSVPNGSYTLTASARDTSGNTRTSVGITVNVSN